jgi:hypothetical protein
MSRTEESQVQEGTRRAKYTEDRAGSSTRRMRWFRFTRGKDGSIMEVQVRPGSGTVREGKIECSRGWG